MLYAARAGCVACAKELVAGGADVELGDPRGITPLLMALLNRHFDTAAALIEGGADVNRWDWWGRSPLYVAIELNQIPDSRRRDLPALDAHTGLDIAAMLLERGANVNMRLKQQPPMRSDPGDRGLTDGSPDVLVINTGATPLHPAVKASDDEAVKLLLAHGANPSAANVFGITPFMAAAGVGHWYGLFIAYPLIGRYKTGADAVETMKLLVAAGAQNRRPDYGLEPRLPAGASRRLDRRARRGVPGLVGGHSVPARPRLGHQCQADESGRHDAP